MMNAIIVAQRTT